MLVHKKWPVPTALNPPDKDELNRRIKQCLVLWKVLLQNMDQCWLNQGGRGTAIIGYVRILIALRSDLTDRLEPPCVERVV